MTARNERDYYAKRAAEERQRQPDAIDPAVAIADDTPSSVERNRVLVDRMIDVSLAAASRLEPLNFGDRGVITVLRHQEVAMAADRLTRHIPLAEAMLVQRKSSDARVDIRVKFAEQLGKQQR